MIETLSITGELIARTSNTAHVQEMVQLSLAPVFLLAGIGAMLNVMNARLVWLIERIAGVENADVQGMAGREREELPALRQRQRYAQRAVSFSTAAGLTICAVVALLFVSAFIRPQIGTAVAVAWILTMTLLSLGLAFFLLETRLATSTARERRKRSRAITERKRRASDDGED